jgi:hypothetical protein
VVKFIEFAETSFYPAPSLKSKLQTLNQITMKNIVKISLFAAAIVAAPELSRAQDATTNAPAITPVAPAAAPAQTTPAPVKPKKQGSVFRGTVSAVDTNAMTLTVETRTFDITSETKITKGGEPATLSDIVTGDKVTGAYKKSEDGKLDATTIRDGKKKKESAETTSTNSVSK